MMATQVKRPSSVGWVGNAVLYCRGDPSRKSYPRNSKGFEELEDYFPRQQESDSDSDSGTEELVQERYRRIQEAKQRRRAQEALAKQQASQRDTQRTNGNHTEDRQDQSVKSPTAVETLQASHLDQEATVTKDDTFTKSDKDGTFTKSTTILRETTQGKESIMAIPIVTHDKELTVTHDKELTVTHDKELMQGEESTMTQGRKSILSQDKGSESMEGTKLSVAGRGQFYSPEKSIHHVSPPPQHKRLQPSRLTFDDEECSPEAPTTAAPPKAKQTNKTKRKKSQSVSMPNKRKSTKPQHHPSVTQPDYSPTKEEPIKETTTHEPDPTFSAQEPDTETTISFNPPISSTLNSDQAATEVKEKKSRSKKQEISTIRPIKKFTESLLSGSEAKGNNGSEVDDGLQNLLKGAQSKLNYLKSAAGMTEDEVEETVKPAKKSIGKAEKVPKKRNEKADNSESLPREPEPVPSDSDGEQTVKKRRKSMKKSVVSKSTSSVKDPTPSDSEGERVVNTRRKSTRKSVAPKPTVEQRKSQRKTAASALLTDKSILLSENSPEPGEQHTTPPPKDSSSSGSPSMALTPLQKSQYGIKKMSLVLTKTTSPRSPFSSKENSQTVKEPSEKTTVKSKAGVAKKKSKVSMPKKGRKNTTVQTEVSAPLPNSTTTSSSVDNTGASPEPVDFDALSDYEPSKSTTQTNVAIEKETSPDSDEQASPMDKSVLPRVRKRKNQEQSVLPKKRHKETPQAPDMSDLLDVTTSPGGREYRRLKVAGRLSKTPGVRRSQRARIAPARPWLNEKVEYDMRRKSGVSLKGVLVPMYPVEDAAPVRKRPHTRKKSAEQEPVVLDEDFEKLIFSGGSDEEEEEWTVVKTKESAPKVDSRGAPVTDLTEVIIHRLHTDHSITSGILTFKPLAMKENSKCNTFQMMFHVTCGKLLFQVNYTNYVVHTGMTVHIPPGSLYSIRNVQRDKAEVFYFTHNMADTSLYESSSSVSPSIEPQ